MSRTMTMIALLGGLSLPLAALAREHADGDAAGKAAHGATDTIRTLTIAEHDNGTMGFSPDALSVRRGETVRFDVINFGRLRHEFRIGTVSGNAEHEAMMRKMPGMEHHEDNSIALAPGATGHLAWTFTRAGTFQYACLIPGHFEAGMHGTITVER